MSHHFLYQLPVETKKITRVVRHVVRHQVSLSGTPRGIENRLYVMWDQGGMWASLLPTLQHAARYYLPVDYRYDAALLVT